MSRALLLTLTLIFAAQTWASVCEDEMKPVTAILRILKNSLSLGDLTPEQVEAALLKGEIKNPFATLDKTIKNIAFRNSFELHEKRVKTDQLESLRTLVRTLLAKQRSRDDQIEVARKDTTYLMFMSVTGRLPLRHSARGMTQGTLEGRPVFVDKLSDGNGQALYLIDPTHPDSARRFVKLEDKLEEEDESSAGFFFQFESEDYFIRFHKARTYDLKRGMGVTFRFSPDPRSDHMQPYAFYYFPQLKKVVSSWARTGENQLHIKSWDLSTDEPSFEQRPYPFVPPTNTPLNISLAKDRAIFGVVPQDVLNEMHFFDYTQKPKHLTTVVLKKPEWRFNPNVSPLVYSSRGRWYALAVVHEANVTSCHLVRLDLQNGNQQKVNLGDIDPAAINSLTYQIVGGQPIAEVRAGTRLAFLKLANRQMLWASPKDNVKSHAYFEWRGETYVLMAVADQGLQIRSMATGEIKTELKLEDMSVDRIFIYYQDGLPKALARGLGQTPFFLDLVHKEKK